MNSHQNMVREFMTAMQQHAPSSPSAENFPSALRIALLKEEVKEFEESVNSSDWMNAIRELCDILYVTYGAAVSLGVDLEPFFQEIHRANMSKLGEDGKPMYREDGKVMKSPSYVPADMQKLFTLFYGSSSMHG